MTLVTCPVCKGEGFVKNTDTLAEEDDVVECKGCSGSGYIDETEIIPF